MCFSGGKDSSLALLALQREGTYRVETLITTVTDAYDRVSMHGVRRSLLRAQAASLGAGLAEVVVPPQSSNEVYERAMAREFDRQYARGIRRVAGPIYSRSVPVARGEVVERDGFVFCDLVSRPDEESVVPPGTG